MPLYLVFYLPYVTNQFNKIDRGFKAYFNQVVINRTNNIYTILQKAVFNPPTHSILQILLFALCLGRKYKIKNCKKVTFELEKIIKVSDLFKNIKYLIIEYNVK